MFYQCPCGGTISIETKFYTWLTDTEIANRCHDRTLRDIGDPFAGSYLETGDRELPEDEDEEDNEDKDYASNHIKDIDWDMTGLDPEGYRDC